MRALILEADPETERSLSVRVDTRTKKRSKRV
jgi:hypothetical protein